jgi:hypothetical protein
MSEPRQLRNHEPIGLAGRDLREGIPQAGAVERALMLPRMFADNDQQAQPAALALGGDRLNLPS